MANLTPGARGIDPGNGGAALARLGGRLVTLAHLVRFSHSVFALPFALASAACAAAYAPLTAGRLGWIVVAMVAARTAAMAWNRLVDEEIDRANPRTRDRELPSGKVSPAGVLGLVIVATGVFIMAAAALGPLPLLLTPIAILILFGYSFTKRFTWASQFALGLALAGAPLGAWIAVTGGLAVAPLLMGAAVLTWVAGFDTIYACQDTTFDRAHGLHSLPARFGIAAALRIARLLHVATVIGLVAFGLVLDRGTFYWIGVAVVLVTLVYEHRLVKANDLSRVNRAFFDLNGVVSLVYLAAVLADRPWMR
jgi:4-hydroxybenzoate polyprenyltransferase